MLLILMLQHGAARAQDVSPLRLKAAFIWNFAKFTEWPAVALRPGQPFTLCVIGNLVVGDALQTTVRGRQLADRNVVVLLSRASDPIPAGCQVLFVSGVSEKEAAQILGSTHSAPVLSISDIEGATALNVMVQFVYEGSRLGFRVQQDLVKKAGLRISSLVLRLSR